MKTTYHICADGHLHFFPTKINNARKIIRDLISGGMIVACWKETEGRNKSSIERVYRSVEEDEPLEYFNNTIKA